MGDNRDKVPYPSARGFTIQKHNSSATVHLFGATLISWIADGREMLFFSKKAFFTGEEITTGGVPVIFPQFGPWGEDAPQHGFGRISTWTLANKVFYYREAFLYAISSAFADTMKPDSITLILQDSAATRMYWNYEFYLEYTLVLIDNRRMKIDITITNPGDEPFPFSFILNNYFSVHDISKCRIYGLKGCSYIDKVKDGKQHVEDTEEIEIAGHTNRAYYNTRVIHRIKNVTSTRDIVIEKMNLPDTIVWNPWSENARDLPDFDDDEWKIMVCVAAGTFNPPTILEPKKTFIASQILTVERNER